MFTRALLGIAFAATFIVLGAFLFRGGSSGRITSSADQEAIEELRKLERRSKALGEIKNLDLESGEVVFDHDAWWILSNFEGLRSKMLSVLFMTAAESPFGSKMIHVTDGTTN